MALDTARLLIRMAMNPLTGEGVMDADLAAVFISKKSAACSSESVKSSTLRYNRRARS